MSAVRYLHLIQFFELASFPTEQCLRSIALHDTACTEDGDTVEIDNGVEAVCDGDDCAVFEFFSDDGLHQGDESGRSTESTSMTFSVRGRHRKD
jgi:hypothetical protein